MEEEIEEKIERYENILFELSESKEVSIIPKLCSIAEDKATELSAVEYLLKVILKIVRNNDIEDGIKQIIEGTLYMVPKARQKAIKLHIWILKDGNLRDKYIEALKNTQYEKKIVIKELLKEIMSMFKDEFNINEILQQI
ncbi:hypothetical protein [Clostridium saccharoperbutylacetonicum]|uniref:hypothetical protein n=1 Tax=Clostridium saccharoperbutylacetonicum TaxID=36745 RepID=UPI0039EC90D4